MGCNYIYISCIYISYICVCVYVKILKEKIKRGEKERQII